MTERLYWQEPNKTEFTATIKRVVPSPGTASQSREADDPSWGLVLDRTLFYPEGGGQPADTGVLELEGEGVQYTVKEVHEEDGAIVHVAALPAAPEAGTRRQVPFVPGACVRGRIDWERRFDHMQQHSGQHVLSQAFLTVLGAHTTGFHLGADYVSIDLDVAEPSAEQVEQVERLANEVVFQDLPVTAREYLPDELPEGVRRRIPKPVAKIRVVHIGAFDACACGGTHVTATGRIGLIKINEITRAHGGTRVIFRCGWRALADYRDKETALLAAAQALKRPPAEVATGIEALAARAEKGEKEAQELRRALLDLEAKALAQEEPGGILVRALAGRAVDELRYLARAAAAARGTPVVLFAREPRFSVVIARGADPGFDARAAAARLGAVLGVRGGGSPEVAQLGGRAALPGGDADVAAKIRQVLAAL
ncbi:MAG: alanyl-tRNA synthetase [Bacillota bacterium]|nr:alanyl-tRNA synthetase [Bacillota bacterium]